MAGTEHGTPKAAFGLSRPTVSIERASQGMRSDRGELAVTRSQVRAVPRWEEEA